MSALFNVGIWAAEAVNEESTKAIFSSREIAPFIQRRKDVVRWNAAVERGDQPAEPFFADGRIDVLFFHDRDANTGGEILLRVGDRRWPGFCREFGSSRIGGRIERGIG